MDNGLTVGIQRIGTDICGKLGTSKNPRQWRHDLIHWFEGGQDAPVWIIRAIGPDVHP
jgi:hypothetical protein